MSSSAFGRKVGLFGAAAAIAFALLMIAYPVAATPTALGVTSATVGTNPPTTLPPPLRQGEQIILTSTSGSYWGLNGPTTNSGSASGTTTLTVVPNESANPVNSYTLSVSGSVTLATTNPPISINIPFTGGTATINAYQTFIVGSGTVQGGTFTFSAFWLSPSVAPTHPLDFNTLQIQLHVGGHYYFVLLHVKTTVVVPTA